MSTWSTSLALTPGAVRRCGGLSMLGRELGRGGSPGSCTSLRERALDGEAAQLRGGEAGQRAAEAADRGAGRGDDHDLLLRRAASAAGFVRTVRRSRETRRRHGEGEGLTGPREPRERRGTRRNEGEHEGTKGRRGRESVDERARTRERGREERGREERGRESEDQRVRAGHRERVRER